MKIRPHEVIVSIQSKEEDNLPTSLEAARLVTYLSNETTNAWNSGYLLRRLKRRFKHLYMSKTDDKKAQDKKEKEKKAESKKTEFHFEEARKLVHSLVLPAIAQQPSTATPLLSEDVTTLPSS